MSKINWAILGTGFIANETAPAIKEVNGRIYAVAGTSFSKAKEFADKYNVEKAYGSAEEMLQDPKVDVVYVATPHSNHYELIKQSLENGKHVLCEKAITVNVLQLKEIVALAKEKGLVVAEAMTIFHMPLFKKLREIVDSGAIGQVKMIQASFGSFKEYDVTNRFFSKDLAGGALLDIGTYALSFVRYFLSEQPTEVHTTVKTFETGVDEQSGIILKNSKDEMAVVNLTMRVKMPKRAVVGGEFGFIEVYNYPRADKATITYTEDGRTETIELGDTNKALQYEIEDMNHFIETKRNDTLDLSVDVMEIMTNVREQWGITYPFE